MLSSPPFLPVEPGNGRCGRSTRNAELVAIGIDHHDQSVGRIVAFMVERRPAVRGWFDRHAENPAQNNPTTFPSSSMSTFM